MLRPKTTGLLLGLLSLALLAGGEVVGGDKGKQLQPARTPEEAVKNILAALQAGDADQLIGQMGQPTREVMQLFIASERVRETSQKALDDKFGKDPNGLTPPSIGESLKRTKNMQIVAKEPAKNNKVLLTIWVTEQQGDKPRVTEQQMYAVKEGDAWKVVILMAGGGKSETVKKKGPDGKEVEVTVRHLDLDKGLADSEKQMAWARTTLPKMKGVYEQVLKDLKGDKFKNRKEAEEALRKVEQRFFEENPPPGVEKTEIKKDTKDR